MEKGKRTSGRLGIVLLAVSIMGILYGWVAYAAEDSPAIDKDVDTVINNTVNGSPLTKPPAPLPGGVTPPAPPFTEVATQFMQQLGEGIQSLVNSSTKSAFYGTGETDAAKAMAYQHFKYYCAGAETGEDCASDPLLKNGDIKVTSIMFGTAYNDADGRRMRAANDYLTNLFVPSTGPLVPNFNEYLKDGKLDIAIVTGDNKLLAKYTKALSDETLLSIPKQSFAEMVAKRTVPGSDAGGISEMQLMEAEAIKRFMSAAWMQTTKNPITPAIQIQQEMAIMQAYQNWMAYQQYRQLERIEALLAGLIVQNARTSQQLAASAPSGPSTETIQNVSGQSGSTRPTP